jgi:chorismate-pyruvate lyase
MSLSVGKVFCACGIGLIWLWTMCGAATVAAQTPGWPDTFVARVEVLALLETLNSELLSHDSATVTLERWCETHRLAAPPRIVAIRVPGAEQPPSPQQRQELAVTQLETVRYRHVKLLCGAVVLSEADNWYVPGRLTPEMNKLLDTTDLPFGKVVQPAHFDRHTQSSELLWRPLEDGWEMNQPPSVNGAPPSANAVKKNTAEGLAPPPTLVIPPKLLEHRAVLTLPDGTPFSEVVETYTEGVLAFPPRVERSAGRARPAPSSLSN